MFALSEHFKSFDPFATQKLNAFRSSEKSIITLASSFQKLVLADSKSLAKGEERNEEGVREQWIQMMEMCLWGNATVCPPPPPFPRSKLMRGG